MPSKDIQVLVGGQLLKLSNLDKVLFPELGIIKAELIQYYQQVAPYILPHISQRPLTLIRYPDGVNENKFYSKNKADWTPSWIAHTPLPDSPDIDYIMANNEATLVWLGNLAAIELHAMTLTAPDFNPNQIIFDLDPPEGCVFEEIKLITKNLGDFLKNLGYEPFLKTSGGKGLHIYVPIVPNYTTETVVNHAKQLALMFINKYPSTTTLALSKERRGTKVLIDIFRNHRSQTCASAYSVRGRGLAPVSMPISWASLNTLQSSQQYNLHNTIAQLKITGDVWAQMNEYATALVSLSNFPNTAEHLPKENTKKDNAPLNADTQGLDNTHVLAKYTEKRNFKTSPEPDAIIEHNNTGLLRYVIQKHQASNLHYDLRLEHNGVLLSWAIPKALPEQAGIKKLAIQTEPHPMKYIDFEGVIPATEYGGGQMWIFDTGQLEYIKLEENKVHFMLKGGKITGEFHLYRTKENQWLIEKKDGILGLSNIPFSPMLAELGHKIPEKYNFEIKWDGIRACIRKEYNKVEIISRNGNAITDKFPEIVEKIRDIDAETALIDGEIVVLNSKGQPVFAQVISRMHTLGTEAINRATKSLPASLYMFDMMFLDGQDLRQLPLEKRRQWLQISFKEGNSLRFSHSFDNGQALFDAIKLQGMEGIICKRPNSRYHSGSRHADWLKVKVQQSEDVFIIGYTQGKGDRSALFGSLILANCIDGKWIFKGKVGTGFNEATMKNIFESLSTIPISAKLIKENIDEEAQAVWINPQLSCEIKYASLTPNGTFREPVFVKMIE
jgi:bifunctional non-homologous end joining protein LigD